MICSYLVSLESRCTSKSRSGCDSCVLCIGRYPTFIDAVRDLDDCLSMCILFSTFPKTRNTHTRLVELCRRLTVEFMHYVISSKSLRKVNDDVSAGTWSGLEILMDLKTNYVPFFSLVMAGFHQHKRNLLPGGGDGADGDVGHASQVRLRGGSPTRSCRCWFHVRASPALHALCSCSILQTLTSESWRPLWISTRQCWALSTTNCTRP